MIIFFYNIIYLIYIKIIIYILLIQFDRTIMCICINLINLKQYKFKLCKNKIKFTIYVILS